MPDSGVPGEGGPRRACVRLRRHTEPRSQHGHRCATPASCTGATRVTGTVHGDGPRGRCTGTAHSCAISVGSSGRAGSVGLAPAVRACSCLCWGPAEAPQDLPPSLTGRFSGTEDVLQRISAVSEAAGCLQGAVCRWAALQSRLRSSTALPKATERPLPEGTEAVTATRQDAEGR